MAARVDREGPLQDATLQQRRLPRGGEKSLPEFPEAMQTGVACPCQVRLVVSDPLLVSSCIDFQAAVQCSAAKN